MKTRIISIIAFLGLLILPANAQFNLNRLGNKVKKQAKEKIIEEKRKAQRKTETEVKQTAEQSVAKSEQSITQSAQNVNGKYNYKTKYTPGKQALASDAKASDKTVEKSFTKSISQIHGAYENLDSRLFKYTPYYNYPMFYYLHNKEDEDFRENECRFILANIAKLYRGDSYSIDFVQIDTPDGKAFVTTDELFRNAWTALFVADPLSPIAFHKFAASLMFEYQGFHHRFKYQLEDNNKGIINKKTGELLAAPSLGVYTEIQNDRAEYALELARNVLTMDFLNYYLEHSIKMCNEETNAFEKFVLYWKIEAIMELIYKEHKDYNPANGATRRLEAAYAALEETSFDIDTNARMQFAATVEIPKGVQIDGATSAKINGMAKEKFGSEYVKTIFLDNKWAEFQESEYPYRVMHLSLPVAIIVKRGGKYLMNYYDVTKSPNGGNWNMMVKMGSTFVPVKY